jgi:UDP-glucose:(heptosyl)LPS alpha-1,3-glucosyltransferase
MKIALVILHAEPARGGAERYTADLAAALARRGHDVTLIASTLEPTPVEGVKVVQLDVAALTRSKRYTLFLDALDSHLASTQYDIVHAMLPVRRCDVYHPHAGIAKSAAEGMSLITRLFNPRRVRFAAVERELLTSGKPPLVLCLSNYVKRAVQRDYPNLPEDKLPILFNAVDLDRFDPAKTPAPPRSERPVALMIAQDFFRKGLREAIEALRLIPGAGRPKLLVVGRGATDAYERITRALRLDSFVSFEGPTDDAYRYYRNADYFLLPTKHDPCSLVVLEALAMGLPVISTVFNGATEIMTDGVHGFVVPDPRDTRAIADAMVKLDDADRRAAMSRACLELRPRLSYEHHLGELLTIYQRIVSAK